MLFCQPVGGNFCTWRGGFVRGIRESVEVFSIAKSEFVNITEREITRHWFRQVIKKSSSFFTNGKEFFLWTFSDSWHSHLRQSPVTYLLSLFSACNLHGKRFVKGFCNSDTSSASACCLCYMTRKVTRCLLSRLSWCCRAFRHFLSSLSTLSFINDSLSFYFAFSLPASREHFHAAKSGCSVFLSRVSVVLISKVSQNMELCALHCRDMRTSQRTVGLG